MPTAQGSVTLLVDPIAQELLQSKIPSRLAYVWPTDDNTFPHKVLLVRGTATLEEV